MSENDIICTVLLRCLSQFWRIMVHYNIQTELFPHLKGIPVFSIFISLKITKTSVRNVILLHNSLLFQL